LKTAEDLRIKGLAEVSWRDDDNENSDQNDSNNNNVNESIAASPSSQLLNASSSPQSASNPALSSLVSNGNNRELFDNKENDYKSLPFLASLNSPRARKRGRPPLDESNHLTRT
jgi:hypothetical protein